MNVDKQLQKKNNFVFQQSVSEIIPTCTWLNRTLQVRSHLGLPFTKYRPNPDAFCMASPVEMKKKQTMEIILDIYFKQKFILAPWLMLLSYIFFKCGYGCRSKSVWIWISSCWTHLRLSCRIPVGIVPICSHDSSLLLLIVFLDVKHSSFKNI